MNRHHRQIHSLLIVILLTTCFFKIENIYAGPLDRLFGSKTESKLVLVFIDMSRSITASDWQIYESTYMAVVDQLKPGDRLVLGRISDKSMPKFISEADRNLKKTGVELDDEEAAATVKKELLQDFEKIKGGNRVSKTYIMEVLNISQQIIESDGTRKIRWIILLSDMIEDSDKYNFEKISLTAEAIHKIINQRKDDKTLPELHGAHIYAVGAGGADSKKYHEIQEFWMEFFKGVNAVCGAGMYGRTTPQFQ